MTILSQKRRCLVFIEVLLLIFATPTLDSVLIRELISLADVGTYVAMYVLVIVTTNDQLSTRVRDMTHHKADGAGPIEKLVGEMNWSL